MFTFLKKYIAVLLFVIAFVFSLTNFKQYGMGWDEQFQRKIGTVNFDYLFSNDQTLLTFMDKEYGIVIELPLVMLEKILKLKDTRDIFLFRHLAMHIFFLLGAFFCFLLVDFLYNNKLLATIGFLLIVINPLIYGHSFDNSKDIPFLTMFLICFYLSAIAFHSKKIKHFLLLGLGVGLLINIRIMGLILLGCILLFLAIDWYLDKISKNNSKKTLHIILTFFFTSLILIFGIKPFLWANPIQNFPVLLKKISNYRIEFVNLFQGQLIQVNETPWHYVPTWFGITTPTFYLFAGFLGCILLLFNFLKKPSYYLLNNKIRNNLFFLICFFSPIFMVIILKPTIYDGWRHLYFIYAPFSLLVIYGLNFLFKTEIKKIAITLTFVAFGFIGYFMVKNLPFQHVYFNEFVNSDAPEYLRSQFELDYWGTAYKQSYEYILKNDDSPAINISVANYSGIVNLDILPSDQRKRIKIVKIEEAKYYITDYRFHPQDYPELINQEWHSFKVKNNSINTIFKLK